MGRLLGVNARDERSAGTELKELAEPGRVQPRAVRHRPFRSTRPPRMLLRVHLVRNLRSMIHLPIEECRRLARLAAEPHCGSAQRLGIADTLRRAAQRRQGDPRASSEELAEIIGMLLAMGEPL